MSSIPALYTDKLMTDNLSSYLKKTNKQKGMFKSNMYAFWLHSHYKLELFERTKEREKGIYLQ